VELRCIATYSRRLEASQNICHPKSQYAATRLIHDNRSYWLNCSYWLNSRHKYQQLEMWQLKLDCHVKPCEVSACAGEGVVPARQHQRLPLLRLRIYRLCLYMRIHPVKCSVPNLRSVAHGQPVKNDNFPAPTYDSTVLCLKPSRWNPRATLKMWRQSPVPFPSYRQTNIHT